MSKSACTYWNPLAAHEQHRWHWLEGLEGQVEEVILSHDPVTGDFTRLTRFHPGADTTSFGPAVHDFPEEVLIVSGRLWDEAFGIWLETGHYASRPPGEVHGPFRTDQGCVVLDVSCPQQQAPTEPDATSTRWQTAAAPPPAAPAQTQPPQEETQGRRSPA